MIIKWFLGGKNMTRALAMVSGGLDSILAAKLIKDQGIEVTLCERCRFGCPVLSSHNRCSSSE